MGQSHSRLLKNTLVYAFGSFGSKILIFVLVPVYSYYVNKDEFGYYDLVNSTLNLVVPFLTLQISQGVFRWLVVNKGDNKIVKKTITNGTITLLVGIILILIVGFIFHIFSSLKYLWWIVLMFIGAMTYPFLQQIARGLGKSKLYALNGLAYSLIYVLSNIVLIGFFKLGAKGIFISSFLAFSIASIYIFFKLSIYKYLDFKSLDKANLIELAKYSLPLVPNQISWWLVSSADKYLILLIIGISANGIYAMSNRFPIILVMVNQIFILAWQEEAIIDYHKKDESSNGQVLSVLIKLQLSLVIVLSLSSQWIVGLLLSKEYYDAWKYMPILFLGTAFNSFSGYYGAFYLGAKKTNKIFSTTLVSAIFSVIVTFCLAHWIGLYGAAIGTASGYILLFFIRKNGVKKITRISNVNVIVIKYFILVGISFIITYYQNQFCSIIALFALVIYLFYDNRFILISFRHKLLDFTRKKYASISK